MSSAFTLKNFILVLMTVVVMLFSITTVVKPPVASALSGSDFQAGRIIDDITFFNGASMSAAEIQAFLNAKVPVCDTWGAKAHSSGQTRAQYGASRGYPAPYTCLKDYTENTPSRAAESGLCNQYVGGVKSAAQIIHDVAMVCGVSQKVLLVLLQKEQSLVTDDWPWSNQYRSATGFGCPDTAPCDAQYYGFFNQVYNAGRIYKKYARDAANYNYRAGRNNNILYNPNQACGSSSVHIQNQATAGLYIYTPYQPNQAALNNLYGTGDSCSSYGNRNFWRMYSDWFGSTLSNDTFSAHPNGTLFSDGQYVFRVENGTKRHVGAAAFVAHGYDWARVKPASTGDRNLIPGAPVWVVPAGTVFTTGDGTVYVADDRSGVLKKQWLSASAFMALGYDWSQIVKTGSSSEVPPITEPGFFENIRHPSGAIVKIDDKVYYIDQYKRRYVSSLAFSSNTYRWGMLVPATAGDRSLPEDSPVSLRPGTMLYSNGNIYVVDMDNNGILKRPIGPWECFGERLRYSSHDWLVASTGALPVRTGPLFTC